MILLVVLRAGLGVGELFTSLSVFNLPLLLLVLSVGLLKTDLELLLTFDFVHGEGLVAVGADDLEGVGLSLDWDKLPLLLLALGFIVHLEKISKFL